MPNRRFFAAFAAAVLAAAAATADTAPKQVVFFTPWSVLLDDSARAVIAAAADAAKTNAAARVLVSAYADRTGGTKVNKLLSETRAQMVVDALEADGVAADRIRSAAYGRTEGSRVASRRAEIQVR